MKNRNLTFYFFLVLLVTFSSCKNEQDYRTIVDKIEAEQKPYHGNLSSEELLAGTDLIKVKEGEFTFLIPERKSKIKSFACTECHTKPLEKMSSNSLDGKRAHWDIRIHHAPMETMNCVTCHSPNKINKLSSLTGKDIDFNLSFKLCAQCHSSQFEDWKGGAHGKKVAGWAPPRASMTCVNCHNPHEPSFESRWPAQFNTQKAIERKEGIEGSEEH